jgi:hypothetical protein
MKNAHTMDQLCDHPSRPANFRGGARGGRWLVAAIALLAAVPAASLGAQAPKVYFACYVPSSGTVYRIKEANTPQECGTTSKKGGQSQPHIEFNWTDGVGANHGALTGLTGDDHPQYLLAQGARNSPNGFAVTGQHEAAAILVPPVSGGGTRMMWIPLRSAFRAGSVSGDQWDAPSIGSFSIALGNSPIADGTNSVALGFQSAAFGGASFAVQGGSALGTRSIAIGEQTSATAFRSVAIGYQTTASGQSSVAIGTLASTNGKSGAFVVGDASQSSPIQAASENQFVARAARFWFGSNNNVTATPDRYIETSTGAFLSAGGTWTNSSDSTRKAGFRDVDPDSVLAKIASIPIRTWHYRDEDSTVRHIGPTAQDFRSAFSLGDSDRAIATVDADGVSLAAIQALIGRTERQTRENGAHVRANAELRAHVEALEARLASLEATLSQLAVRSTTNTSRR